MATTQSDGSRLVALLEGRACPSCSDGKLEKGRYKGNEAVICDSCETPRAQLW